MQTLTLSENEITTLRGALEVARGIYLRHAEDLRNPVGYMPAHDSLARQFERQAADADRLLETLDE